MAQSNRYGILRTAKIKTRGELKRSLKHGFREQDTPNAASELTPNNTYIGGNSSAEVMQHFNERLATQANIRKNAVLGIEYLVTTSSEVFNNRTREAQDGYFNAALDWLKEKHGSENVIHAGIHRDEKTPHMYVFVVPFDDKGKLNCRHFLGGSKNVLSDLQTEFHEKVCKQFNLDRGIKGSKAKHNRVMDYYKNLNNNEGLSVSPGDIDTTPKAIKKGLIMTTYETPKQAEARVVDGLKAKMQRGIDAIKAVGSLESKLEASTKTANALNRQLDELKDESKGLTDEERQAALRAARIAKDVEAKAAKRRAMFQAQGVANKNAPQEAKSPKSKDSGRG